MDLAADVPPVDAPAAVVDRLVAAGCVAAREEAAELVRAAADAATLDEMVTRREAGVPLPWITGSIEFGGRRLRVDPGVYVPRFQSEELAARAAALLPPDGRAVDLCTGSGAIAAHLRAEVPGARVIGVDHDAHAARCARANRVPVLVADLAAPIRLAPTVALAGGTIDVITAVAPYVPTGRLALLPPDVVRHEPLLALDGGPDGLDLVRAVVTAAAHLLRPGGWVLVELGGDQDHALAPMLDRYGFGRVEPWRDDDGDLRGVAAQRA